MDGEQRGGAAISFKVYRVNSCCFCWIGEKISDLENFLPDRMASRILGMGDVLTLIEKAEESIDMEAEEKLARKMLKNQFTLNDFLKQLQSIKKMGSLESIIRMIPGLGHKLPADWISDENALKHRRQLSIDDRKEREQPEIINGAEIEE
jgi:signal recognition particle subunit SRP54